MAEHIRSPELDDLPRLIADQQRLLRAESEDLLRTLSERQSARRGELWRRDYSSASAYVKSVEPNRMRWQAAVGDPQALDLPPVEGEVEMRPVLEDELMSVGRVSLPVSGHLRARALLALPRNNKQPAPLVIAQHGIESSPERVMGLDQPSGAYHAYGRELVRAGYAVLAPLNLTGHDPRARVQRLCLMLGMTAWGLEIYKLRSLLDWAVKRPEVDPERIGMWGISLGGAYTLFTMPLEPRIKAGICTAWFNDRLRKMIIDDPRYSCFLSTKEEHIFIPRWLAEFDDADLASLICPRPLQVQCGKADAIAWWPYVAEEVERAKAHYDRLGLGSAVEFALHEGGHEIHLDAGLRFLGDHLWS